MHDKKRSLSAILGTALGAIVLASPASAQPCVQTNPPPVVVTGYNVATPPHAFTSIAGNPGTITVWTGTADDNISIPAIPFPFPLLTYEGNVNTYQVSANGFVTFNQTYNPGFFIGHAPIPDVGDPNGWATPWYDDLLHTTTAPASNTYRLLQGTAPNRTLTIEWNNLRQFPNPGACVPNGTERVTTQLVIHEATGNLEFKYDPGSFNAGLGCWVALVGVENLGGSIGTDPTGAGPFNAALPATDFVLSPILGPGPPPVITQTYSVNAIAPGFTSIVGDPAATVLFSPTLQPPCPDDNNTLVPVLIPFPFDFYGVAEAVIVVNANGFFTFDNLWSGAGFNNPLGSPAAPNRVVAPFWQDLLHVDPASQTAWKVSGTAPNQQLILEWTDLAVWEAAGCIDSMTRFTFQAVLKQGSNDIEFRYGPSMPVGTSTATAAIGLEDATGINFVDVTGMGSGNMTFPATNVRLDPCEPCGDIKLFGAGCPTSGATIPVIGTSGGAPTPGNLAFGVTQSSGTPSATAILVIGVSKNAWGAIPLPANLAFLGNPACTLNVSVDIMVNTATNGAGSVTVPVAIPPSVAACAAQIFFQWADIDPLLLPGGFLAMSRGLWVTIG